MKSIDLNCPSFARSSAARAHDLPRFCARRSRKTTGFCTDLRDPYLQAHFQLIAGQELSATLRKNARAKPSGAREKMDIAPTPREGSRKTRDSAAASAGGRLFFIRQQLRRFVVGEILNLRQESRELGLVRSRRKRGAV